MTLFLKWKKDLCRSGFFIVFLFMTLMLVGCLPVKEEKPMAVVIQEYNHDLARFIPDKPFSWKYSGTADYMHEMTVANTYETEAAKIVKVKGEVKDQSSGEGSMDFSIAMTYTIGTEDILQEKKAKAMLDSEFDSLIILKSPVKKGTTWEQPVVYPDGRKSTVKAFISEITSEGIARVVTVDYKDEGTHYFEKRKIKEGAGVIEFHKTMNYNSEKVEMGYQLLSTEVTMPEAVAGGNGQIAGTTSDGKEEESIGNAVRDFDSGWIDFVNNGGNKIYATLVKDGQAYKLVKNFKHDGSTQKFEEIRINGVEILENKAQAKVYERIKQTKGDQTRIMTYNWIYHLQKVGDAWLIDYYEQDKSIKGTSTN